MLYATELIIACVFFVPVLSLHEAASGPLPSYVSKKWCTMLIMVFAPFPVCAASSIR